MKKPEDYEWSGAGGNTWRTLVKTAKGTYTAWVAMVVMDPNGCPCGPRRYEAMGFDAPATCPRHWPAMQPWYRVASNPKNCYKDFDEACRASLKLAGVTGQALRLAI